MFELGAPTLAEGSVSSYTTFLTPNTHTILIVIKKTLFFLESSPYKSRNIASIRSSVRDHQ